MCIPIYCKTRVFAGRHCPIMWSHDLMSRLRKSMLRPHSLIVRPYNADVRSHNANARTYIGIVRPRNARACPHHPRAAARNARVRPRNALACRHTAVARPRTSGPRDRPETSTTSGAARCSARRGFSQRENSHLCAIVFGGSVRLNCRGCDPQVRHCFSGPAPLQKPRSIRFPTVRPVPSAPACATAMKDRRWPARGNSHGTANDHNIGEQQGHESTTPEPSAPPRWRAPALRHSSSPKRPVAVNGQGRLANLDGSPPSHPPRHALRGSDREQPPASRAEIR